MKSLSLVLLLSVAQNAAAFVRGINFGSNNPDGSCKSYEQWKKAFTHMKSFPGNFTSARTFSTHDCDAIVKVARAAKETGVSVLVGVWTTSDDGHFTLEKNALQSAVQANGHDWIQGFIVGNEDLYRKDLDPNILVRRINDLRGLARSMGITKPVGHSDTFSGWTVPANSEVIKAVDFVGHQGYPYWQGTHVNDGQRVFWEGYRKTKSAVNLHKPGTPMWITEAGWPVTGSTKGNAVASVPNARNYYKQVACDAFRFNNLWWYAYQEPYPDPSFGVVDINNNLLYDLSC